MYGWGNQGGWGYGGWDHHHHNSGWDNHHHHGGW